MEAGAKLDMSQPGKYAYMHGPRYLGGGGYKLVENVTEYQPGDVVIFAPIGSHTSGHAQWFDGDIWRSDCKQKGFYPHKDYKAGNYAVYRYMGRIRKKSESQQE